MNDIKLLRIVGEGDIIAKVEVVDNKVILTKPKSIGFTPNGVGLLNFPLTAELFQYPDEPLGVDISTVLWMVEPKAEIVSAYNSQVLGGISLPSKSLVLPS